MRWMRSLVGGLPGSRFGLAPGSLAGGACAAALMAGLTGCAGSGPERGPSAAPQSVSDGPLSEGEALPGALAHAPSGRGDPIDYARVRDKLEKVRTRGPKPQTHPQEAMNYFYNQRMGPGMDEYPIDRIQRIAERIRQPRPRPAGGGAEPQGGLMIPGGLDAWTEIGPGNIGGRTRAIAISPEPNKDGTYDVLAAGVAGGVFESTLVEAGEPVEPWTPTSDFLSNIAFTTLAMDPGDPSVVYGGTGEGFFNSDAVRGLGIFKSTDGGQTWDQLEGTISSKDNPIPEDAFYYVNKIQVSPNNSSRVYAATRTGVWRSTDAGGSWQLVLANTAEASGLNDAGFSFVGATDLQIRTDTGGQDTLFAAFGSFDEDGLYRSTDSGQTWQQLGTTSTVDRPDQGRMTIAIAPSDQDTIYVAMADASGAIIDVYRSTDGGDSWAPRLNSDNPFSELLFTNVPIANGCFGSAMLNQGWYDNIIAVDPTDPGVVWVGGIDLFRSDDGGQNFGLASYWYFDRGGPDEEADEHYVHADQHTIAFHPEYNGASNQTMIVGNDGGLFRTDNALAQTSTNGCPANSPEPLPAIDWQPLNKGYGVTQYYHGDASQQSDLFIGGAQDNGTSRIASRQTPDQWEQVLDGDGGYVQIDPTDDQIVFAETTGFASISKSTDGGLSFEDTSEDLREDGAPRDEGLFITPFHMAPGDPDTIWTGGHRAWRSTDQGGSWEAASNNFADGDLDPNLVSAIATAPSDPDRIYLGFANGFVVTSSNADDAMPTEEQEDWQIRSDGLPINFGAFISDIAVDPGDEDIAYAASSTFGVDHVYKTTDGGETWEPIDGIGREGIPDIPVHSIAISPTDSDTLYAGTEVGVFASLDGGQSWVAATTGLPSTVVEELTFRNDETLVAFTHGRGTFITDQPPCPADLTGPNGEPDGQVTSADFLEYINLFAAGDLRADFGGGPNGEPDGQITSADFLAYIDAFAQGCP